MAKPLDITGQTFGQLTALEPAGRDRHNKPMWRCRCACGNYHETSTSNLTGQRVRSCGCMKGVPMEREYAVPRSSLPRKPAVRPWLRLSEAERAILRVRIDQMLIHAAMKQERVTA